MASSVTVGKFIPGNSAIHKLNPVVKLASNIILIVLVFMSNSFILLGSLLVLAILTFLISKLDYKQLWRMLIPVLFIAFFLFIINTFLITDGYATNAKTGGVDYNNTLHNGYFFNTRKVWKLTISDKVLFQTGMIMIRIYIMIIITTLLTATTRPAALTKAIEDLLMPLKLLFIPVHIIAMIISIALRFIPTLLEEAQRIMKAQASRGVDFKNGGPRSKSKAMITLIIPLFVSAFSKAEDLGQAMETRGYDPYEKRTKYRTYPIRIKDVFAMLIILGFIVFIALYKQDMIPMHKWWV